MGKILGLGLLLVVVAGACAGPSLDPGSPQSFSDVSVAFARDLPLKGEGAACLAWLKQMPAKPCKWSPWLYRGGNWKENFNCWVGWCGNSYGFAGCFYPNNEQCGRWTWVIMGSGHCTFDFPKDCPDRYYPAEDQDEPEGFTPIP